jgi:hypothetical protein
VAAGALPPDRAVREAGRTANIAQPGGGFGVIELVEPVRAAGWHQPAGERLQRHPEISDGEEGDSHVNSKKV